MKRSTVISLVALAVLPHPATSSGVVVSQIYGGGGNSGAPLARDFVELFNPDPESASLEGWAIQYATARGATWQVTPLSGAIAPGGYFLVAEARGAGEGAELVAYDVDGVIALSANSGKIALTRTVEPLSGACPESRDLVSLVGYGSADCYSGSGAAPGLANDTAAVRRQRGCAHSGDDANDFVADAPAPRSSSDAREPCSPPEPTFAASPSPAPPSTPTVTPIFTATDPPLPTASCTSTPTATPTASASPTLPPTSTPLPSSTPTPSATLVATPSRTSSPSPTEPSRRTATPSATPTRERDCGNGRSDADEQCDDGNHEDGDLCPSSSESACRYTDSGSLIHGHPRLRRVRQRGCWLGWYVAAAGGLDRRRGAPLPHQTCRDQDAGCDFDPTPGRCEFRLVACLNTDGAGLPACEPRGVGVIEVVAPRGQSAVSSSNRQAIAGGLASLREPGGFDATIGVAPPLTPSQRDYCSGAIAVGIDLGALARRSESIVLRSRATDGSGMRFDSRLRLTCERGS